MPLTHNREAFRANDFYSSLGDWELQYVSTPGKVRTPITQGDEIETAQRMYRKYAALADEYYRPMQWSDCEYAGFSKHEPWLCVNPNFHEINVDQALKDKHSIFYTYQRLIQMRKEMEIFSQGDYHLLDTSDQIFAYERNWNNQKLVVIANFFEKPCAFPDIDIEGMQVLLHNYEAIDGKQLRAYEAMILFKG